jgi:hypothetical protein
MTSVISRPSVEQFTRSALELVRQCSVGSKIHLVEREGRIHIFSEEDSNSGRAVIHHVVTPADIEFASQYDEPE